MPANSRTINHANSRYILETNSAAALTTDYISINKDVRQRCDIWPVLLDLYVKNYIEGKIIK